LAYLKGHERMTGKRIFAALAASCFVLSTLGAPLRGDQYIYVLRHGGRLVGDLVNPDQVPRETYVVRTAGGIEITLDRSQVKERIYLRPDKTAYEKIRPRYSDTVEGQWELAEWCRQKRLQAERERHLERILELDPNHERARRALGYGHRDGEWKTQEQAMKEQGYVWYQRHWRLPQEVKLLKEKETAKDAEGEWNGKIEQWRRWLNDDKARLAVENIRSVDNPNAVKALSNALREEPIDQRRILFIEALARIGTPSAMRVLAVWSLADPVEEVGLTCIDYLKERNDHNAVEYYIGQLRSKDNTQVNRAATALEHMGNSVAIPALMDTLVTSHKFKISKGNPGQMSTSFGTGGSGSPGGLTVGGGPVIMTRHFQNRAVLEALVALTGGKNFGFDVARWKSWYASQQRGLHLDARRG
jgi:hypothetical protein